MAANACSWQARKCSIVCETVNSHIHAAGCSTAPCTKKLKRRRVEPTAIEPYSPQSTWAHSPGAKAASGTPRGARGRTLAHVVLDDRDAARRSRPRAGAGRSAARCRDGSPASAPPAPLNGSSRLARGADCSRSVLRALHPLGHRLRMQSQRARGLRDRQPLAIMVIADLAEGLVVDHGGALPKQCAQPSERAALSIVLARGRAIVRGSASRASTW